MYRAVAAAKQALSSADVAPLTLQFGDEIVERALDRRDFERWIAPDLAAINHAVDRCLAASGVSETGIDRVFLTGGSSFVPAVRRLFTDRFPEGRVESGDQLVSIALGLALIGAEPDITPWTVS